MIRIAGIVTLCAAFALTSGAAILSSRPTKPAEQKTLAQFQGVKQLQKPAPKAITRADAIYEHQMVLAALNRAIRHTELAGIK